MEKKVLFSFKFGQKKPHIKLLNWKPALLVYSHIQWGNGLYM